MRSIRYNKRKTAIGNRDRGRGRSASTILFLVLFFLGVFLLVYPTFSNWWNERHQSRAIASYDGTVSDTDTSEVEAMLAAADAYNIALRHAREDGTLIMGVLTDEQLEEYNSLLDVTGTGIMGYVRIPKINVELPIYHGTDEGVLQIAVGHIEGTSLPIGGTGTHAVISGHTGLPSATLFTDIDNLGIGDVFMITCLGRKVTYEVDQIDTVLPSELDELEIDPDEDYCTLVTCTPYGINSHRLLVRGHRIANLLDDEIETIQIDIPERELSMQERIQNVLLPYVLILAAGFLGLALILPARRPSDRDDDPEDGGDDSYNRGARSGENRYEGNGDRDDWDQDHDHSGDGCVDQDAHDRQDIDDDIDRDQVVPEHYLNDPDADIDAPMTADEPRRSRSRGSGRTTSQDGLREWRDDILGDGFDYDMDHDVRSAMNDMTGTGTSEPEFYDEDDHEETSRHVTDPAGDDRRDAPGADDPDDTMDPHDEEPVYYDDEDEDTYE